MKVAASLPRAFGHFIFLAIFAGCQNPYAKFYTQTLPPDHERWLLPHTSETQFFYSSQSEIKGSTDDLVRRGFIVVGYASFEANAGDYTSALRAKAKDIQADIVLQDSSYAGTRNGVMPLITYHPGQSSTTTSTGQVNTNIYGNGGYAQGTGTYSGTSTTTSPGTFDTSYVPYSVQRNSYGAVFLRKYHYLVGARWIPLNDEQRKLLQRNTGLVVKVVVEGTPAFIANILPGDILITIDGDAIVSSDWLNQRTLEKAGQVVKFGLLRDGVEKVIELRVDPVTPAIVAPQPNTQSG
jgi:hypothetical protein